MQSCFERLLNQREGKREREREREGEREIGKERERIFMDLTPKQAKGDKELSVANNNKSLGHLKTGIRNSPSQ